MALIRAPALTLMQGESSRSRLSPNVRKRSLKVLSDDLCHSTNDLSLMKDEQGASGIKFSPLMRRRGSGGNVSVDSSMEIPTADIIPSKLKIGIREKKEGEQEGSIFYKDDEHRFSQQYTVKLKTFSEYNITVQVTPPRHLSYVKMGDTTHRQFTEDDISQRKGTAVYSFVWSTNRIRTTKRAHRSILPCVVKFECCKEINFEMFVKFYFSCEEVHYKGTPLSFIELDHDIVDNGDDEEEMDDPTPRRGSIARYK